MAIYKDCDEALCDDCASGFVWEGFEDWDTPLDIDPGEPVDSPVHCCECGVLISEELTDDGRAYVAQAVLECVREGLLNPVTAVWASVFEVSASEVLASLSLDPVWEEREDLRKYVERMREVV